MADDQTLPGGPDGAAGVGAPPAAGASVDGDGDGDGTLLELRGVSKRFGAVQALTDVNLTIPAGKVTALVGDNGAGKSVTIKCIAGIHSPDHGEILFEGRPVHIHTP